MIERLYLKEYLSFDEVELEFEKGLVVFTGPSGAGKSILIKAFLGVFGLDSSEASLCEVNLLNTSLEQESFDIAKNESLSIKQLKKEKTRFFLNAQTISKKMLQQFSYKLIKHLHLKDTSDFESESILQLLDAVACSEYSEYSDIKNQYIEEFKKLQSAQKEYEHICEQESQIQQLIEFTRFEIDKIQEVNPQVDEVEELFEIKKKLSKKDKIQEALQGANDIFTHTHKVSAALDVMEVDSSFFDEAMNELENIFESSKDFLEGLDEIDIEQTLDRIEKISALQKRFGGIQEALEYKAQKEQELQKYENISFEKAILEKNIQKSTKKANESAQQIHEYRQKVMPEVMQKINHYLQLLYLHDAQVVLSEQSLCQSGKDKASFELSGISLSKISSGEFNRLRLAFLTVQSEYILQEGGVLFLDEIDANLSGKESESIAKVLKILSKKYQIFAISHQPQLTSLAHQHFLVSKHEGVSTVKPLLKEQRVQEIARMISGENITQKAREFAHNLFYQR